MMYNYLESMIEDVKTYIEDHIDLNEIRSTDDLEALEVKLNDECFISDSVTGNASGSYYCNSWKAREALHGNEDLLIEALEGFGDVLEDYKRALTDPEFADVTIRCYLLGRAISEAIEDIEINEEGEEDEQNAD